MRLCISALSAAFFVSLKVHCTQLCMCVCLGLAMDGARHRSVCAHAFHSVAVPAQSSRELSLALAVAAQCGVVERAK